jgi:hypothetical protein
MAFLKGILATGLVASALIAVPVQAQRAAPMIATAGDDPGFAEAGLTTLAAIDGRGYSLAADFVTMYDGNMLRIGDGQVLRPGQQKADVRMTPTVTGRIGVPIGRQQLFAGASVGGDVYANNGQLNSFRLIAGGGLNLRAGSRCTSTIAADYTSRQLLLSDVADTIPNVQDTFSYGISASCQAPAGLGAMITVRQINTGNSSAARTGFDLNSLVISPSLTYFRPALGSFSLFATINYVSYPNRFVLTPEGMVEEDAVNIFSTGINYSRTLGSRMSFGVGLNYFQSAPQPQTILAEDSDLEIFFPTDRPTVSGLGYNASLTYTPSGRLQGTLSASRNSTASPNVGAQFQIVTLFGADINYTLNRSIVLGFGGTYSIRDYENSFVTIDQPLPRAQDKISRVYGRISYSPPRPWNLSLLLAYQNRASLPEIYSFGSFSAVLSLSIDFQRTS